MRKYDSKLHAILSDLIYSKSDSADVLLFAQRTVGVMRSPGIKAETLLLVTEMARRLKQQRLARDSTFEAFKQVRLRDGSCAEYVIDTAKKLKIRGLEKFRSEAVALKNRQREERFRKRANRCGGSTDRPKSRPWRYQVENRIDRLLKQRRWMALLRELEIEAQIKDSCIRVVDRDAMSEAIYSNPRAERILLPVLRPWQSDVDYLLCDLFERALVDKNVDRALAYLSLVQSRDRKAWFIVGVFHDYVHRKGMWEKK